MKHEREPTQAVKDTFGALPLNHVLYGLATRSTFEAWRRP